MNENFRDYYASIRSLNDRMPQMFDDNIRLIYTNVLELGDSAIDCGSHTGKHTFPMAECVGISGRIYAFEPIPEKIRIARSRMEREGTSNIVLKQCAIGDAPAEGVEFFYIKNEPGQSSFQLRKSHDLDALDLVRLKARVVTLDDEFPDTRIALIKMDVEGHEFKALLGANELISRNRPVVCMEHGTGVYENQVPSGKYFEYFDDIDYDVFDILGNHLQSEEQFCESAAAAGVWDYWMAPRESSESKRLEALLKETYVREAFCPTVSVTVGVVSYNAAAYLPSCIQSLLKQTFQDFEIIVVDDGSTDESACYLDSIEEQSEKVRVLRQENFGQGISRNRILTAARGEYITFVDADDWLSENCLDAAYRHATRNSLDLLYFGWVRVNVPNGEAVDRRRDFVGKNFGDPAEIRTAAFSGELNLMTCASLVRTRLFHSAALRYPSTIHEDIYVSPFLCLYGSRHGYLSGDYYIWRIRSDSVTGTVSERHIDGIVGAFRFWKYRLSNEQSFSAYRHAFILGSFAYLSTLLDRIDRGSQFPEHLRRYLRERLRTIPEIEWFDNIVSPSKLQSRAKVIEFILTDRVTESRRATRPEAIFDKLLEANSRLRAEVSKVDVSSANSVSFDFAFAPHKDYHVQTAVPVAEILRRIGASVCFLDFTRVHRNEGVRTAVDSLAEKECHDIVAFIARGHSFKNLVVFNDWDRQTTRPLVQGAQLAQLSTIGFVEGINDFSDSDTGRNREAYQTVEWVLGTGEHDRQHFVGHGDKFDVVGFPRIADLLTRSYRTPDHVRAVINVNFTYGVLEDHRDDWLRSAIEGCELAGIDWVISQHPADAGDLSKHPVDGREFLEVMYENAILISRFSSCIIETIAMGRPVIYHNPGIEKVQKFRDSHGAYSVSDDSRSLARAIAYELQHPDSVMDRRNSFLAEHCDVSANYSPHMKAAATLQRIRALPSNARLSKKGKDEGHRSGSGKYESVSGPKASRRTGDFVTGRSVYGQIARHIWKWLATPTAVTLVVSIVLICTGISNMEWNSWVARAGLILLGIVVAKEAIVWRWRRKSYLEQLVAERIRVDTAVESERTRTTIALDEAIASERNRATTELAAALANERDKAQESLADAFASERANSRKALADVLAGERAEAKKALTDALASERAKVQKSLTDALANERANAEMALGNALARERAKSEKLLTDALHIERSDRSLVDAFVSDYGLPVRRILLIFAVHRSGSTWLFDLLRTHPAARVEPSARTWSGLGIDGWRYPGAFHHVDGAVVPIEVAPGFGATIPMFPLAEIPDIEWMDVADRWVVEKAHPEFVGFDASRLASRIYGLRSRGVEVEVVYLIRRPLDSMWSMAEFKERNPNWYRSLGVEGIPEFVSKTLDVIAELYNGVGGSVVEYDDLPDGSRIRELCKRLDSSWSEFAVEAWISHAASVTKRSSRRQRPDSGFLGKSDRGRPDAGPDGSWNSRKFYIDAANLTYDRLIATETRTHDNGPSGTSGTA